MFPFWQDVVAPILEAAAARRIVEVGALRGENTELMLDRLDPAAELHVVDPLPEFDPALHEAKFPGRYVFHRDLSVNVLGALPPMDAALLDGDHNWYTVLTELRLLAEVARSSDAPFPVCILHDVAWPYGRRDLYYDPSNIPEEHRQPWQRRGMRLGQERLVAGAGGMNAALANAEVEGGPRNGVMTGVDDFITEHDQPLRLVFLPIYFGLAILVEERRLTDQPELAAVLDHLESREGKDRLLELGEAIRLEAAIWDQALTNVREERISGLTTRYLDSVKRAIVNDHHVEDEVRIHHLRTTVARGGGENPGLLRDPLRYAADDVRRVQLQRQTGEPAPSGTDDRSERAEDEGIARQGFATAGRVGLDHLQERLDAVWSPQERGDFAVCGVGFGGPSVFLAAYLQARDFDHRPLHRRKLWIVDRFRYDEGRADLNQIREALDRFDVLDNQVRFLQGDPLATLPDIEADRLLVVYVGPGLGADVAPVLDQLYPKLVPGGAIVFEDALEPETAAAIATYRQVHGIETVTERVGRAGMHWVKAGPHGEPAAVTAAPPVGASRSPLAARLRVGGPDLSVVIVTHNMRREAMRSLHALSRRYQLDVDDLDYEVIVVENGSDPDERLGEALVTSFGREFRYIDLGDQAPASPVVALNRGIAEGAGGAYAFIIDGAHLVTPRVLRYGMAGLNTYAPAIVATQQWYVGPGQQGDAMSGGYDEAQEDRLFEQIEWPRDGYRLFDIGHFIGDRDWFDGVWESNCLFVGRELLEQVGGFDEAFVMPGGGYTNLDLYERLASAPGVRVVSIIGEGSFHQVHGGTTTNLPDPLERRSRVRSYTEHYADLRGQAFMGPDKPMHYVGGMHTDSALRSRSRRMTASAFAVDPSLEGADGPAEAPPIPVADDLKAAFTNAYYRSLAWRQTRWIGQPVRNAPTDLVVYQELLHELRPDWIIETGTTDGGRAYFLATICDLLGHGQVVSVAPGVVAGRPDHPRITYVTGLAHDSDVVEQVRAIVGPDPRAMVILGTHGASRRTRREFDAYSTMVPVGSYVIVEHTALNGFPIDASFGPGPHEAVRRIMNVQGEFVVDSEREKQSLTFNPGGFLKRIK
jgi:cephalosporin hydroxylase/predicted O-methyltransferase YrrM